jgi:hypothetical protein
MLAKSCTKDRELKGVCTKKPDTDSARHKVDDTIKEPESASRVPRCCYQVARARALNS